MAYAPAMTAPSIYLAPGASGGMRSIEPYLRGMRALGHSATAVTLPRGAAERAVAALPGGRHRDRRSSADSRLVDGSHPCWPPRIRRRSPARPAVLPAARTRPGRTVAERTEHWPRISCPVLLLSGDRDPFARIGLLREAVGQLPHADLHVYPGGPRLGPVTNDALERLAGFAARLPDPYTHGSDISDGSVPLLRHGGRCRSALLRRLWLGPVEGRPHDLRADRHDRDLRPPGIDRPR